jgi:5,10-methylenetetrahydrofolate reductase
MLRDTFNDRKVITLEVLLPLTRPVDTLYAKLDSCVDYIDAINIPSNPLGKLRPDALCYAHLIQEKLGIEAIPHFVARHFTSLGFESHLLGASALNIKNILCVTGDSPVGGRSAFELNSAKLLDIAKSLQNGSTSSRKTIPPVDFCLCTSFNPNVLNIQGEYIKSALKYRAGAEVFFTQPVFNTDQFLAIVREFRSRYMHAKIVAGLSYLHTQKRAFSLMKFLGIPYEYIKQIEARDETEMLLETAQQLEAHVDGFYVIPINKYSLAADLLKKLRALL